MRAGTTVGGATRCLVLPEDQQQRSLAWPAELAGLDLDQVPSSGSLNLDQSLSLRSGSLRVWDWTPQSEDGFRM